MCDKYTTSCICQNSQLYSTVTLMYANKKFHLEDLEFSEWNAYCVTRV